MCFNRFIKYGLLALGLASNQLNAKDISQTLSQQEDSDYIAIGLQLSAGVSSNFYADESTIYSVNILINAEHSWGPLFVELYGENAQGLAMGFELWQTPTWQLDLISGINYGQSSDINLGRGEKWNNGIYQRDIEQTLMTGLRAIHTSSNGLTTQFMITADSSGKHKGHQVTLSTGYSWQVKNWNLHAMAGVEYSDDKFNQHHIGIDQQQADTSGLPLYQAASSIIFSSELGVTYPLAENWVFSSGIKLVRIPNSINDSPYFHEKRSVAGQIRTSVSYVF